ncbi:MAG: type II toxin-antitoxin system RelE/ParE family toxin, partial [Campylobacterota bacterium]|nr:type II toxin-antitoxin system RelE/ParE family toxin [Campylobacterota bacterium]
IFLAIKEQGNNLNTMPLRHRIVPELQLLGITRYREIIYKRWRIIYRVSQESVFIVAIFDTARNLEDILFERLIQSP